MNNNDLTNGLQDFFNDDTHTSDSGPIIGGIGAWILHLVVFAFAIYSGYHGINATARYHADSGLGMVAGIVGILVIEAVLIGLYLAYFNRRITGSAQKVAAGATALLGFTLSCLGIIGDSQMQVGMTVSPWLSTYLTWGLPIAPAIMALGAAIVVGTEPKLLRQMAEAVQHEQFEETKHAKRLAKKNAELVVAQNLVNVQLNTQMQAARYILAAYRSPEVQAHIERAAIANLPELLRTVGVDLPYGAVIEGQAIEVQPSTETAAEQPSPPHSRSWIDNLRDKLADAILSNNGSDDAENDTLRHTESEPSLNTGQGGRAPVYQAFADLTPEQLRRFVSELDNLKSAPEIISTNGNDAGRPQ